MTLLHLHSKMSPTQFVDAKNVSTSIFLSAMFYEFTFLISKTLSFVNIPTYCCVHEISSCWLQSFDGYRQ